MSHCPHCKKSYLLIPGFYPPPCLFLVNDEVYEDSRFPKYFFSSIICECGQKIGRVIFSGQKYTGWWEFQIQDKAQNSTVNNCFDNFKNLLQNGVLQSTSKCYSEQLQTRMSLLMTEKLIRQANRSLSKSK